MSESGKPRQKRKDDFHLGEVLGQGAFGQVLKVTDKETGREYAMKILSKQHIIKEKKMDYVKVERDVMTKLNHPNIVRLVLTFQDPENLHYVIEYASGGDLQRVLNEHKSLDTEIVQVVMGQTILALAHMHQNRIIHRDLKPENMLLDGERRLKITDFGTAKIFSADVPFELEKGSFVGSADYVCPETLMEVPVGPSSDLWSFACILYAFIAGVPPFRAESNYAIFERIQAGNYTFPDWFPADAKDLISKLLIVEAKDRLGHGEYGDGYASIREHPFFSKITDWDSLPNESPPPWAPFRKTAGVTRAASASVIAPSNPAALSPDAGHETSKSMIVTGTSSEIQPESGQSKYPHFLLTTEKCILEGPIVKKRYLSVKKRWLVLTSNPRLFYVNQETKQVMGEIPLNSETKVVLGGGDKWSIEVPGRVYSLQVSGAPSPSEWKEKIERQMARKR
jgi:3-phosphoinositide dependent protein kinase-1